MSHLWQLTGTSLPLHAERAQHAQNSRWTLPGIPTLKNVRFFGPFLATDAPPASPANGSSSPGSPPPPEPPVEDNGPAPPGANSTSPAPASNAVITPGKGSGDNKTKSSTKKPPEVPSASTKNSTNSNTTGDSTADKKAQNSEEKQPEPVSNNKKKTKGAEASPAGTNTSDSQGDGTQANTTQVKLPKGTSVRLSKGHHLTITGRVNTPLQKFPLAVQHLTGLSNDSVPDNYVRSVQLLPDINANLQADTEAYLLPGSQPTTSTSLLELQAGSKLRILTAQFAPAAQQAANVSAVTPGGRRLLADPATELEVELADNTKFFVNATEETLKSPNPQVVLFSHQLRPPAAPPVDTKPSPTPDPSPAPSPSPGTSPAPNPPAAGACMQQRRRVYRRLLAFACTGLVCLSSSLIVEPELAVTTVLQQWVSCFPCIAPAGVSGWTLSDIAK